MSGSIRTRVFGGWKAFALVAFALVIASVLVAAPTADAASYKKATYTSSSSGSMYTVKVGKATFKTTGTYDSTKGGTVYTLTMTKNGKTKTLAKKVDGIFTTNGKYVFYAKRGARVTSDTNSMEWMWNHRKNTIYRLNVKTGAKKKIVSGTNIVPYGAQGKYLYYGKYPSAASDTQTLYALNTKTKKKRELAGPTFVGICKGRVITHGWSNAGGGVPLYSYKKSGKGKVTIATNTVGISDAVAIKGKKVRYIVTDEGSLCRVYQCTASGKSKIALCAWTSSGYSTLRDAYL